MKKECNFGWIHISIIIFFICIMLIINFFFNKIDERIEYIKTESLEIIEGIECEFTYKDIHYNGICTEELLEDLENLVSYDRQLELLKICMNQPYAYKWELCEEVLQ